MKQTLSPLMIVEDDEVFEVQERVDQHGSVLTPLDPAEVERLAEKIRDQGATSVAVCLLFSFVSPEHEQVLSAKLRATRLEVSSSSEILPESASTSAQAQLR